MIIYDSKNILNLPKTEFSMKADLFKKEHYILKFWKNIKLYHYIQKENIYKKTFIITDGPPYANGKIHIGHALNKILKDIINKSKLFSNYNIVFIPGWDCHGLPIELSIKKTRNKDLVEQPDDFLNNCKNYALNQVKVQRKDFIRLGILADWYNPYITIDYKFKHNILHVLLKIIKNQNISIDHKPVYWCSVCRSSLAEAEIEYKKKYTFSIYILFKSQYIDKTTKCFLHNTNLSSDINIIIWTTTPWTLPLNQSITLKSRSLYILISFGAINIILAKDSLFLVLKKKNIFEYKLIGICLGQELKQEMFIHPICGKLVPITFGNHINLGLGTGCVHTAPAHGHEDYIIGKKYGLKINNSINEIGLFKKDISYLNNIHIYNSEPKIIEILLKNYKLFFIDKIIHDYPYCWRHKHPLIFRSTQQWFIDIYKNKLCDKILKFISNKINCGNNILSTMIKNRPNWCISRQRKWGVPINFYINKHTRLLHYNIYIIINYTSEQIKINTNIPWLAIFRNKNYIINNNILDVWFDSGCVQQILSLEHCLVSDTSDIYIEGHDQYRGWFQTSLICSIASNSNLPCKKILTHGFVVDQDGLKMSKSLKNVISPNQIINKFGSDILRLWVSSIDYYNNIHISKNILLRITDSYRKIRNTIKFMLSILHDFNSSYYDFDFSKITNINSWMIYYIYMVNTKVHHAYNNYSFTTIYKKINNYCTILGGGYFNIVKHIQYTCKPNSVIKKYTQFTINLILTNLIKWLSPIISFTGEETWQYICGSTKHTILNTMWEKYPKKLAVNNIMFWKKIIIIRSRLNKIIDNYKLNKNTTSSKLGLILYCTYPLFLILKPIKRELPLLLCLSKAEILYSFLNKYGKSDIMNFHIIVIKTKYIKCYRCWGKNQTVNIIKNYLKLCMTCIKSLHIGI